MKCKHCGHTWSTQSEAVQVTCPSCMRKTPNENENKNDN